MSMISMDDAAAFVAEDVGRALLPVASEAVATRLGRHHLIVQRGRARVGWLKRRRRSASGVGTAGVLHRSFVNATYAVRDVDLLPVGEEGPTTLCSSYGYGTKRAGRGMYQIFTPVAFLRMAFAPAYETGTEVSKRFKSSASGKPCSVRHVLDSKMCIAQLLRDEVLGYTSSVFNQQQNEYRIRSLSLDEAGFTVSAAGECAMESPILGSSCSLLTRATSSAHPEFTNLHAPCVVMRNKSGA